MSKIEFKEFVKKNKNLIEYVNSGKTTWQQLYELYDLYGESSNIWNNYKDNSSNQLINNINSFSSIFNYLKNIDLDNIKSCINSLDKAIDAFREIIPSNNKNNNYEAKPSYKEYDD